MKLEISDYDLRTISKLQEYVAKDTSPQTYYLFKRSLTLLKNINKQLTPPVVKGRKLTLDK